MGKRILVIDDDADFRVTLRAMLERLGCTVSEAENGTQGLKRFAADQPDLIITDMLMPEREGFETITDIRRQDPSANIVAVSGGGATGNMIFLEIAERIGANKTLQKPIQFDDLAAIVRAL